MFQQHFAGLDISVKETAICIIDVHGELVHRASVESDAFGIREHLLSLDLAFGRIGLEG